MNMHSDISTEKILGMYWDKAVDEFKFELKFYRVDPEVLEQKRRPTKREMLSIAMSIFDPFGLLANFLVYTKILLQEVWKSGIEWDEQLPDMIYSKWVSWQTELINVKSFSIPRCYSLHLYTCTDIQLHVFVDASETAFASVAYFRIQSSENNIEITFVAGKTKCAPQKLLSIPRLELQSAVLGVRLSKSILEFSEVKISKCIFWSDSKTVIHWIKSDHRKYKPFVAHRVSEILEYSKTSDWRWVPTNFNSADAATRAKFPPKFRLDSPWVKGPTFLTKPEEFWPTMPSDFKNQEFPEEIRTKHFSLLNNRPETLIDLKKYSDYFKVKRIVAWVLRFIYNSRSKQKRYNRRIGELGVKEVEAAEMYLCRNAQTDSYPEEYETLIKNKPIDKSSSIYQINPKLDEQQVLRIFGRIDNAMALPISTRRPIIMPKSHILTSLIVSSYHRRWHHQNQETIIVEIRSKFWIPHLRTLVKQAKSKCQLCKIRSAKPQVPLMGQLPIDRLTPFVRPFTYTGLDYYGPIYVSIGRRCEKRWVALFTCLTVRAVHIELADELSTDSCILCLRNFVNRRGVPLRIRSDNGTNFVGAEKELRTAVELFDHNKIQCEMTMRGIEWIFNCPSNPNAGGCWERLVQSIKRVLRHTLKEISPRVETLRSLLIEAENIVNSRPLTHIPITTDEEEPLTPNHFLLGTLNSTQTPGPDDKKLFSLRKQWRIAQHLKNMFWKRWIAEYLPVLTRRTKWFKTVEPIKIDDIVIVCDSELPRTKWPRGRVTQVFTAKDGQVRSAEIKTSHGTLKRPASKLAVLDVRVGKSSVDDLRWSECCESTSFTRV